MSEVDFWRPILDETPLNLNGYHIGYFRNIAQVGKVLRWKLLPDLLRNEVRDEWRPVVQEYGDNNFQYLKTVRAAASERAEGEVKWLVDNSKDPYRLFCLQHSGRFRIRVIHLMKDPRAFVCSMTKDGHTTDLKKVLRYTGRWIIENAIISRVTYKELALSPDRTLRDRTEWLDLEHKASLVDTFREYENHALSGNMMRWRQSEEEIYYDDEWKEELPPLGANTVALLAAPFAEYCGYPKFGTIR